MPNKPRGVPRVNDHRILNGIFWVLRSGAPWRDLLEVYGPNTNLTAARAPGVALGSASERPASKEDGEEGNHRSSPPPNREPPLVRMSQTDSPRMLINQLFLSRAPAGFSDHPFSTGGDGNVGGRLSGQQSFGEFTPRGHLAHPCTTGGAGNSQRELIRSPA
jgi:hypothetical protein